MFQAALQVISHSSIYALLVQVIAEVAAVPDHLNALAASTIIVYLVDNAFVL